MINLYINEMEAICGEEFINEFLPFMDESLFLLFLCFLIWWFCVFKRSGGSGRDPSRGADGSVGCG